MLKQRSEKFIGKKDDPISGPHSFWMHFWFGFIWGGFAGTFVGWKIPQNLGLVRWPEEPSLVWIGLAAFVGALLGAALSAHWGDRFWSQ